jgi:23S rRNA U2552 (ribose-2'-O)-methylase RlmE/FtsJ
MLDGLIKIELGSKVKYPLILPEISLKTIKKGKVRNEKHFLNGLERDHLEILKNQIDISYTNREWDKAKKLSNPYELIHIPNRKIKSESISSYDPLSRSFFKLWEIIHYFGLIDSPRKIKTAHLAEGPGGFLEAVYYYRSQRWDTEIFGSFEDKFHGITLAPTNKDIPGWGKAYNLIRKAKPHIEISYGEDHTGDIYKISNLEHFNQVISDGDEMGADLITADGGFDFSINFNLQEQSALQLIFAEVLGALMCQKIGGHFVCKFFDTYNKTTLKIIYLLKCLYSDVFLFKPLTSRPANAEKYLVAKGFKGFDNDVYGKEYMKELKNILTEWSYLKTKGYLVFDIFGKIPDKFYQEIVEFNNISYQLQSKYINQTLKIISEKPKWNQMKEILHYQVKNAIEWCQAYHIPINQKSYFYQKYILESEGEPLVQDKYYEQFLGYNDDDVVE